MSFEKLGLSSVLCRVIQSLHYEKPTVIQSEAIPYVLRGMDILASAQTGTGKTASFLLPLVDILSEGSSKARLPRLIILEPTRELAIQVMEHFKKFTSHTKLSAVVLVGGESMIEQEKALKKGVDVIIATPGRLLDLIDRQKIMLPEIRYVVIDEADRMLDMGFIPDVNRLMAIIPKKRQTLLFSATLADEIVGLAAQYLLSPKRITVDQEQTTAITVTQYKVKALDKEKRQVVRHLIETFSKDSQAIVFCNRKKEVDILVGSLVRHGFQAAGLHGDLSQTKRNETLDLFRGGTMKVLVASDVAARGLDVKNLSLVINFNVPNGAEDYVHRIGRTGRAGTTGSAFTLVSATEEKNWDTIEKQLSFHLESYEVPKLDKVKKMPYQKSERKEKKYFHEEPDTPVLGFGSVIPAFMNIDIH